MKKTIDGKTYNTDTAKLVASYSNDIPGGDLRSCSEYLYIKRTGEFFLHGVGGAMTKYAEPDGPNCWSSGEQIIPMTKYQAIRWTIEYGMDEIERMVLESDPSEWNENTIKWLCAIEKIALPRAKPVDAMRAAVYHLRTVSAIDRAVEISMADYADLRSAALAPAATPADAKALAVWMAQNVYFTWNGEYFDIGDGLKLQSVYDRDAKTHRWEIV